MPVITDSPTSHQPLAGAKRLRTHCLSIGNQDHRHASLTTQTESIDAITVVSSNQVKPISAALQNIKSDLIFFLQDADRWTDDFVAQISAVYQNHPAADVVCCDSNIATNERQLTSTA